MERLNKYSAQEKVDIVNAAIAAFADQESRFAQEMRWDERYLLEFIERICDSSTVLPTWDFTLVKMLDK